MFNPKVTIVIPVYNWSNYLAEAINSALTQSYNNIEVIVIDDGSNDWWKTKDIALSYGDKIIFVSKENWWTSTALNEWIHLMTWEYFSWLSHDDLYYPSKIEEQINALKVCKNKNTLIYTNIEKIDSIWNSIKKNIYSNIPNEKVLFSLLIREHGINGCTTLINKDIFKQVWLFDNSKTRIQDYDMRFRIVAKFPVYFINKNLIKCREHPWQDSNSRNYKDEKDLLDVRGSNIKLYSIKYLYKNSVYKGFRFLYKYIFIWLEMIIVRRTILNLYMRNHKKTARLISRILSKLWFQLYYL